MAKQPLASEFTKLLLYPNDPEVGFCPLICKQIAVTAKLGSVDGVTFPVSVKVPTTTEPPAGFRNSTLAGSSGRVMLVDA